MESELIRSDAADADAGNDFSDKQGFQLAPPFAKIGGAESDAENALHLSKMPKVDWSYTSYSEKMSLLKHVPSQTRLTQYYELIN